MVQYIEYMKSIRWTGEGSDPGGLHTKKRFLELMRTIYSDHVYWRMRGDTHVPPGKIKKNDIDGWMRLVGASTLQAKP
jgi:hypothetical protein